MTIVVPLRMRSAPLQISGDVGIVLRNLRDLCFLDDRDTPMKYVEGLSLGNPETILVDDVCEKIVASIAKVSVEPDESIFIDVGGPTFDETVPPKIARALADAVDELNTKYSLSKVAMLLQRQYASSDRFVRHLEMNCCQYGSMLLFADTGNRFNANNDKTWSNDVADKIRNWCVLATGSNKENLRLKLIRHRGFYSLTIGAKKTVSVFDGRNCVGEISELTLNRLKERFGDAVINVLVDDQNSRWMTDAAHNAKMQAGSAVSFYFTSEGTAFLPADDFDAVLFSVVRSGDTAREILTSSIYKFKPDAYLWALVSAEKSFVNIQEPHVKTISLPHGKSATIFVELVKDAGDDDHLTALWSKSPLAPFPVNKIELRDPFRADEMWSLLLESGIKAETEVPRNRPGFKWVPDMSNFVGVHGPLLAGKIAASLSAQSGTERVPQGTYFFVHPQEPAAVTLVDFVCRVTKKRSIGVMRALLDRVQSVTSLQALGQALDAPELIKHYQTLLRITENEKLSTINMGEDPVKVVLIDEFSGTGDTIDQLKKLSRLFGWDVQAVICPLLMGSRTPKNESIDYAYYEFGLPI